MTVRVTEFKFDVKYINAVEINSLLGTYFQKKSNFWNKTFENKSITKDHRLIEYKTNEQNTKIFELKYGNKKLLNMFGNITR